MDEECGEFFPNQQFTAFNIYFWAFYGLSIDNSHLIDDQCQLIDQLSNIDY